MWVTPSLIFWGSLGIIGYTYAGYPGVIWALSRLRPRRVRSASITPLVSVVLAARNEEQHIGRKLDNLLALDYPAEKLEIIVVSDGSTDGTDEIVARFVDRGVLLERVDPAGGKPSALNAGVGRARGEIVLFCDARQRVAHDALRRIIAPFADEEVGAVSGTLEMESDQGPGLYWAYEKAIRRAESMVDSIVTCTGAFFAIRRQLFRELPPELLVDDLYTPLQIALQGYRVVVEPEAKIFDKEVNVRGEFARKARTLAGNFQVPAKLPQLLNPLRNRVFFQYASHKLMRLVCPFALVSLLGANIVLVATAAPPWPFYLTTLVGQLSCYALALKGAIQGEGADRLSRVCHTFVVLNAAAVEGLRRYLRGDFSWTTVRHDAVEHAGG